MARKYTTKDRQNVVKLYKNEGMTINQISQALDIPFATVQRFLNQENIPRRPQGHSQMFNPYQRTKLREQGLTLDAIANHTTIKKIAGRKISYDLIRRLLGVHSKK